MAYVYLHRKADTKEVFYVGIGKKANYARAYQEQRRSIYWKNVADKHGYVVEIVHEDVSWAEAGQLERGLIQQYGRRDLGLGSLVNLTDGGCGTLKRIEKPKTLTPEHRQKIASALRGKTRPEEVRRKVSESKRALGIKWTPELRERIMASRSLQYTPERSARMSKLTKGEANPFFGKSHTDETKRKISEKKKGITGKQSGPFKGMIEVYKSGQLVGTYEGGIRCAEAMGIGHRGIYRVVSGERKAYKGFVFKRVA